MAITGAISRTRDLLRRDFRSGAVLGFVLILVTLAICYDGVRQIGAARDAQASLDHADRYLQGTMRGAGELILSEGASAQIEALQTNLRKTDEALTGLGGDLSYAIASTQSIAGGDLSVELEVDPKDTTSLHYALRTIKENLTRMVQDIRNGAETIRTAAASTQASADQLVQSVSVFKLNGVAPAPHTVSEWA